MTQTNCTANKGLSSLQTQTITTVCSTCNTATQDLQSDKHQTADYSLTATTERTAAGKRLSSYQPLASRLTQ